MSLQSLFDLTGKTALVTGCDKGIGKAYAIALAEAGADIIGASRSLESGSAIEKEITALDKKFRPYKVDLGDRSSVYAFIENVKSENKSVDILVNNAGTILRKAAAEHPDDYWDKVIDINLNAQFILTREFGKDMIENGSGKVVGAKRIVVRPQ